MADKEDAGDAEMVASSESDLGSDDDEAKMEEADEALEEEECKNEAKVKELDQILAADPSNYQAHVDRVAALQALAELERLREAREEFSKVYPLSPELWLQWLEDERGLANTDQEKERVFALFQRATRDYVSPDIWLEYCQFSLCGLGTVEGASRAREVFEAAVAAVGLHVAKGALIWEAYREFESALLSLAGTEKEKKTQKERVDKLFRRQLTVPLLDMDSTFEEYREWLGGRDPDRSVTAAFKEALRLLKEREELETDLLKMEAGVENAEVQEARLRRYDDYFGLEKKAGLPVRVRSLCERRITRHCLEPRVWTEYLRYLDSTFKDADASLPVYERASRNCPWSGEIWVSYLRCLERHGRPQKEVVAAFERALQGGLGGQDAYVSVWQAFIDFKRRQMKFDDYGDDEDDKREKERDEMRELFGKAVEHLARLGADPECRVARYWASMEGDRFRAMDEARKIWADVLAAVGDRAKYWSEYIGMEKALGDTKHLRKLYPKALEKCRDWPETIGEMWLQFEREEGSLEQLEEAERKVEKRMDRVVAERAKEEEQRKEMEQRKQDKVEKKKERDKEKRRDRRHELAERKRKAMDDNNEEEKFKMPPPPGFIKPTLPPSSKDEGAAAKIVAPPPGFKGNIKPPPGFKESPAKKAKLEEKEGSSQGGDAANTSTVFVSNLDYSTREEELEEALSSSGTVKEVRLVRRPDGSSKGYAYVQFSSPEEARAAQGRDRETLKGRPMFISEMDPEKRGHQFKYQMGLEEKKLFVRGLPQTCGREELEEIFGEFGKVVDVRIVTFRNGHSKGIAFVEYDEARSAKAAVQRADGTVVGGKTISVAISNPPQRRPQAAPAGRGGGINADAISSSFPSSSSSLGGGPRDPGGGSRKSRVQVSLVPRSVQVRSAPQAPSAANGSHKGNGEAASDAEKRPRSNEDFRDMLLGKK